ncbi:MAG: HNH endonuclease [Phototrophicaceae bacterium]
MHYCCYCGRMQHRCTCQQTDSPLQRFLTLAVPTKPYHPCYQPTPYKRGVPPLLKQRQRAQLKKHYAIYYEQLVAHLGAKCGHCGEGGRLVLDHIIPIAKGGISELTNLQLLCPRCNLAKGKLAYRCVTRLTDG